MKIRTSVGKPVFSLILTLALACSTASQTSTIGSLLFEDGLTHSLRSRARTPLQLRRTPTTAPSGEVPLCMVHKVAQEASRRTTPARALAHAVAPPLDRTSRRIAATLETAFVTSS